ncbi:substrate-binding periplasmic protein [Candidatus Pelagadaptatus aseana]|uniref:substrate-binding periplasmic protein n=1 Tax=Candidatus Pelagadaptatus aseana TaxID=3120508 RepID=UPI003C6F7B75
MKLLTTQLLRLVTGLLTLSICLPLTADPIATPTITPVKFATTTVKPWGIRSAGVNQGLLISVLGELEKVTGIPVANQMQPYPRVVHSLHSGQVDMAFLFDSDESKQVAIHIGHLVDTRMIAIGRSDGTQLNSLEDFTDKTVALIRGGKYSPSFNKATHFKRTYVSNMEQGIAMLLSARIDVMVGSDQAIFWSMQKMNVGPRRLKKLFVMNGTSGSLYMSKNSNRQDLIPVYKQALATLHANGTIDRIFDAKYEWANADDLP